MANVVNPSAFPSVLEERVSMYSDVPATMHTDLREGMTLLDYFAGQALCGTLAALQ